MNDLVFEWTQNQSGGFWVCVYAGPRNNYYTAGYVTRESSGLYQALFSGDASLHLQPEAPPSCKTLEAAKRIVEAALIERSLRAK